MWPFYQINIRHPEMTTWWWWWWPEQASDSQINSGSTMLYSCHVRQKATCVCFVRRGEDGIKGGNPKSGATALISQFSESEWGGTAAAAGVSELCHYSSRCCFCSSPIISLVNSLSTHSGWVNATLNELFAEEVGWWNWRELSFKWAAHHALAVGSDKGI